MYILYLWTLRACSGLDEYFSSITHLACPPKIRTSTLMLATAILALPLAAEAFSFGVMPAPHLGRTAALSMGTEFEEYLAKRNAGQFAGQASLAETEKELIEWEKYDIDFDGGDSGSGAVGDGNCDLEDQHNSPTVIRGAGRAADRVAGDSSGMVGRGRVQSAVVSRDQKAKNYFGRSTGYAEEIKDERRWKEVRLDNPHANPNSNPNSNAHSKAHSNAHPDPLSPRPSLAPTLSRPHPLSPRPSLAPTLSRPNPLSPRPSLAPTLSRPHPLSPPPSLAPTRAPHTSSTLCLQPPPRPRRLSSGTMARTGPSFVSSSRTGRTKRRSRSRTVAWGMLGSWAKTTRECSAAEAVPAARARCRFCLKKCRVLHLLSHKVSRLPPFVSQSVASSTFCLKKYHVFHPFVSKGVYCEGRARQ